MKLLTCEVLVSGIVQGIGYRPFVYNLAQDFNITGFVRNLGDAGVHIIAQGQKADLETFLSALKTKKPDLCAYDKFTINWIDGPSIYSSFTISDSSQEKKSVGFSYFPPDIAICSTCVQELYGQERRRQSYPFNSCVHCGPRFTVIKSLPYDRPNTIMEDFPFCFDCLREYTNSKDRRFHAQTTCCTDCGPSYTLYSNQKESLSFPSTLKMLQFIATEIENNGKIVAIKGIGGTHLACSTLNDKVLLSLREAKGDRKYKPFAIMAKNIDTVKTFTHISKQEEELLSSFRTPIVLLNKLPSYYLSEWIAPNLHNVGVMLPYAGIHHLLLNVLKEPTLVMTSANPSNYPMYIDNDEIMDKLSFVDYFLLHNRRIFQRCDDSVIRLNTINSKPSVRFLRRSRGWVPEPLISHVSSGQDTLVGLGAEMHLCSALMKGNRILPTQYIGTVTLLETFDFMLEAINNLLSLYNTDVKAIAYDLHPQYLTSTSIDEIAQHFNVSSIYPFQHHKAHIASVALEHHISPEEEVIGIALDGTGYGEDGKIWGGEIFAGKITELERIAHIEEYPLIGGDAAVRNPARIVLSLLAKHYSPDEIPRLLETHNVQLPLNHTEISFILDQVSNKKYPSRHLTTSTGRFLDAVSSLLGICQKQTFEGEPAIKLESFALNNCDSTQIIPFSIPLSQDGISKQIQLSHIFAQLLEYKSSHSVSALAYSIQAELGRTLGTIVKEEAKNRGITKILLSGGVSINQIIPDFISRNLDASLQLYTNNKLSPGDGCISVGQVFLLSLLND